MLTQFFFNALVGLTAILPGHSVGWAIVILTVLVQLILAPFRSHAFRSQRKLMALQPHLKALKEKHHGDRQAEMAATMQLYKEHGVQPLGSCLTSLAQIPIIFVLYRVMVEGVKPEKFDLLYSFIPRPESVSNLFFGLDLTSKASLLLAILVGATQFIYSWQLTTPGKKAVENQPAPDFSQAFQKQLLYAFPIMTVFIARTLPSALSIYWITMTVFGIVQQEWIRRRMKIDLAPGVVASPAESVVTYKDVTVTIRKKDHQSPFRD